jgi:hypothetical protein
MMERIEVTHVPSLEPAIERSCEPSTLELHFAAFSIRFVTHTNTFIGGGAHRLFRATRLCRKYFRASTS